MPLPDTIPVRYTEEEAGSISVRPVVRQTFRLHELLDMILGVTGKDAARVAQVLRAGTIVFHYYRYWWSAMEAPAEELAAWLRSFPDADPARPFAADRCQRVRLESTDSARRAPTEFTRAESTSRGWLRRRSLWDIWMEFAATSTLRYETYSYAEHADVYAAPLAESGRATLLAAALHAAPRHLRGSVERLRDAGRILFLCSR